MSSLADTIAAIASAPGGGLRGIVRISGPDAVAAVENCFRPVSADCTPLSCVARPTAIPGTLELPAPLGEVPADVYLWPSCRSYTREPMAEIHTLGSPPLLEAAVRAVCATGARPASPGEFTLRAFLAGRIDLTQAEAVLGVIDAAGDRQLDVALAQLAGGMATPLTKLRGQLLDLLAHLEAGLDFVEEDIEFISRDELRKQLCTAADQVKWLAAQMALRGTAETEVAVVLLGWPNVGKSSLLNALAGEAAAIVSPQAGTTRDYLTRSVTLAGVRCLLVDTAGIEPDATPAGIPAAAQEMAAGQASRAGFVLFCLDATRPSNAWELAQLSQPAARDRLVVMTKCDQLSPGEISARLSALALEGAITSPNFYAVTSSRTGQGLEELRMRIAAGIAASRLGETNVVAGTALRCGESLRQAAGCLTHALETLDEAGGEELVAADLRSALDELGKVAGAVYTDDVLDRIFSRFCIGK